MGQVVFQALSKRCRFETDRAVGAFVRHTDIRQTDEAVHLCVCEMTGVIPPQVGLQPVWALIEQVCVLIASI